ncbi:MAG: glycerol acyltransferase [Chloroflexi bacterium]|nr:glycerol acyltransferase [Chloroflexota bacterium]
MTETKTPWWQRLGKWALKVSGWKLIDNRPPEQKYLVIGAFHTTNWDLPLALALLSALGIRPRWIGKDSLFRGPWGPLMRWLGGIPVKRGARLNFVQQMAQRIKEAEGDFVVVIAPEGTRKATDHWKTGFYYIALEAGVPIAFGFGDYPSKTCGIGDYLYPTGDTEADLEKIRAFYANVRGKHPQNHGTIRFKPRKPQPLSDDGASEAVKSDAAPRQDG